MKSSYVVKYTGQETSKTCSSGEVVIRFDKQNNYIADVHAAVCNYVHNKQEQMVVTKRLYVHLIKDVECIPYLDPQNIKDFLIEVRNDSFIRKVEQKFNDEINKMTIDGLREIESLKLSRESQRKNVMDKIDKSINDAMNEFETNKMMYNNLNEELSNEESESRRLEIEEKQKQVKGPLSSSEKKYIILNRERDKQIKQALEDIDKVIVDAEMNNHKAVQDKMAEKSNILSEALALFRKTEEQDKGILQAILDFKNPMLEEKKNTPIKTESITSKKEGSK